VTVEGGPLASQTAEASAREIAFIRANFAEIMHGTIPNLDTEQAAHRPTTRSWASSPTCEPAATPSALTTPNVYPNVKT
jgi:hypothetical protein